MANYYSISKTDKIFIPGWLCEDLFEDKSYIPKENYSFDLSMFEYVLHRRKENSKLCYWYPILVKHKIPIIPSKIIELQKLPSIDFRNQLDFETEDIFVRCCNASPKDTKCIFDIFDDTKDIFDAIKTSKRAILDCHLILRPVVKIRYEFRAFWHDHQLRAICAFSYIDETQKENIKGQLTSFFDIHKIPFNSVTVDVAILENDDVVIVELNEFGFESRASAELYRWNEDYMILYHSLTPNFRFKKEFEW